MLLLQINFFIYIIFKWVNKIYPNIIILKLSQLTRTWIIYTCVNLFYYFWINTLTLTIPSWFSILSNVSVNAKSKVHSLKSIYSNNFDFYIKCMNISFLNFIPLSLNVLSFYKLTFFKLFTSLKPNYNSYIP